MVKKGIISLLVAEVLLIVAIVVSFAFEPEAELMTEIAEVVTFSDSDGVNTEVDLAVFNKTENEAYTDKKSFEIHMELLDDIDVNKVVDLVDNGLLLYVVGDDLSTQKIGDILGIEEVSSQGVNGAKLTRVTIYKSDYSYGCIMGGEAVAEWVPYNGSEGAAV